MVKSNLRVDLGKKVKISENTTPTMQKKKNRRLDWNLHKAYGTKNGNLAFYIYIYKKGSDVSFTGPSGHTLIFPTSVRKCMVRMREALKWSRSLRKENCKGTKEGRFRN